MTVHLAIEDVLALGGRMLGGRFRVLDWGLLESALARPQVSMFGEDAYPTIDEKAAALLHSLVRNRVLSEGNNRLGWAATVLFYALNGRHVPAREDEQVELVRSIADGSMTRVDEIATRLRRWAAAPER